jgi:hypothetical protein
MGIYLVNSLESIRRESKRNDTRRVELTLLSMMESLQIDGNGLVPEVTSVALDPRLFALLARSSRLEKGGIVSGSSGVSGSRKAPCTKGIERCNIKIEHKDNADTSVCSPVPLALMIRDGPATLDHRASVGLQRRISDLESQN